MRAQHTNNYKDISVNTVLFIQQPILFSIALHDRCLCGTSAFKPNSLACYHSISLTMLLKQYDGHLSFDNVWLCIFVVWRLPFFDRLIVSLQTNFHAVSMHIFLV